MIKPVTNKKNAPAQTETETILFDTNRKLELSQHAAHIGNFEFDFLTGAWTGSAVLADILGVSDLENFDFDAWLLAIHREDRDDVVSYFNRRVLYEKQTFNREYRIVRKNDGATRWVHGIGQLVFDAAHKPIGLFGTIQDINEQYMVRDELARKEEQYRLLFGHMRSGFALHEMLYNPDGSPNDYRYLEVNPAFERLTGLDSVNVVGKTARSIQPDIEERWIQTFARIASSGESVEYLNYVDALGKYFDTMAFSPRPGQFAILFNDVTQQHRDEALRDQLVNELKIKNAALERSNQELDDFTYIASHDLKEPLRAISNYSSFLLEDYGARMDDEGKRMLGVLVGQSARMEELISALLRYSRIGRITPQEKPVDLREVIDQVRADLDARLSQPDTRLQVETDLPIISCDRELIRDVFVNLVSNALKYNDKSEKQVYIGCVGCADDNTCELYVRDNGIGIPEKHFKNIFRLFKRLHTRDKYGGGVGAGLTIVKKIITAHHGRIWLESVCGQGTTFRFTLKGAHT